MSKEAVQNLIEQSKCDEQLLAQLQAAPGPEAVLAIASERGYEFTEEELISVMQEQQLSFDDEPVEINETAFNFVKEVGNNDAWKKELETINTPADIVRYAADKGYEFSEEDIVNVIQHQQDMASTEGELSEDALEAIAGGRASWECKVTVGGDIGGGRRSSGGRTSRGRGGRSGGGSRSGGGRGW